MKKNVCKLKCASLDGKTSGANSDTGAGTYGRGWWRRRFDLMEMKYLGVCAEVRAAVGNYPRTTTS